MESAVGREITPDNFGGHFIQENFAPIYSQAIKDFQALVSLEQFEQMGKDYNKGVKEYQLEMSTSMHHLTQYIWLDTKRQKGIAVAFDEMNVIHSIYLRPFLTYPRSDKAYTKNTYQMPIAEGWLVFWGGTNEFVNYHYAYEQQRYAYDLVIEKEKQSFEGSGEQNEHYYAYGKEIFAPADGKVVKVLDGIEDNVPGVMNEAIAEGNCVVIEHDHKEYSMLAHLKKGSILVKEGEMVEQGQLIGQCGNSGNSSEAHLHFQVMDSQDYHTGKSIRIRLKGNEPIQGETVSHSKTSKENDKVDRFDTAITLGDILLTIGRFFSQLFK